MHGAMISIESKKKYDRYTTNRIGELEYTITLKLYDQKHKVTNNPYQECKHLL